MPDQPQQVTSASQWNTQKKKEEGSLIIDLPSGNRVRIVRTFDLPMLLKSGRIPNPLATIVRGMIETRTTVFPPDQMDTKVLTQLLDLLDDHVARSMIEPPVSRPRKRGVDAAGQKFEESEEEYNNFLSEWEPEPDTVSIFDIDMEDKLYIFAVGQGGAADLASFRREQEQRLDSLQKSKSVRKSSKRVTKAK